MQMPILEMHLWSKLLSDLMIRKFLCLVDIFLFWIFFNVICTLWRNHYAWLKLVIQVSKVSVINWLKQVTKWFNLGLFNWQLMGPIQPAGDFRPAHQWVHLKKSLFEDLNAIHMVANFFIQNNIWF